MHSALTFFETEYKNLDERTLSILKSEITRMTNVFISDFDIQNTFSPPKKEANFPGFYEVIKSGKIVVLNMNIAVYKNLSKLVAAYLKLDFQAEVLAQLSTGFIKPSAFICDEFHEYVTSTDSEFFAQSREAKCMNIVATQSYTSLLNSLKDQYAVKAIVQNLINKLWYRTDDTFTIEDAQKQIGKEDKTKTSKSISENAQETNYNYRPIKHKIIWVGNDPVRKGLIYCAKAATILKQKYTDLDFRIIGSIDNKYKDIAVFKDLNFIGTLTSSELKEEYRTAEAYVFPTLSEGFAGTVIEAASCGCPIITTECAGTDLEAFPAIYIPIQDVNAIVDSVTSILENSKYRDQLSLKTFQYSQALTPETYEKRLISIFKSI